MKLAAGALSIVFIPIFLGYLERGDDKRGWHAFSVIANFLVLAGTLGLVLLFYFARPLTALVAPGYTDPADVDTLVRLTRIILPAQIFHLVGGLLSAALQAKNRHLLPALAPLVYSAGIIAGGLIGTQYPALGADGFAWGVLAGSIVGPFGLPLAGCIRSHMRWLPIFSFRDADLRRYLFLSAPIMIGFSIVVVDEWIVKNQASYLGVGALSYLQYGRTLMKVPIGIFGMAAGVAAYPTISSLVATGQVKEAYDLLARAIRLVLTLTFAAQICLTVAGFDAVYLVWGLFANRFSVTDAQATATVLGFLCLGLGGWATQTVISRGFYALESTWLPTLVGTIIAVLMVPLYVALRIEAGTAGLAIASSLAIIVYVAVLGFLQRRRFEREAAARGTTLDRSSALLPATLRLAAAAAIAIGVGLTLRIGLAHWLGGQHALVVILRAALLCSVSVGLYAVLAYLFGVADVTEVARLVRRRLAGRAAPSDRGGSPDGG